LLNTWRWGKSPNPLMDMVLQCVYWNWGHPHNEIQLEGRTETIDSNIFKSSQSNVQYKTIKSQLIRGLVMFTRLCCWSNPKLKPIVLSRAHGFRKNYMMHSAYLRLLVDLENKSCVRVLLLIILSHVKSLAIASSQNLAEVEHFLGCLWRLKGLKFVIDCILTFRTSLPQVFIDLVHVFIDLVHVSYLPYEGCSSNPTSREIDLNNPEI